MTQIFLVLAIIFVISSLYFNISGRIISKHERKEDIERYNRTNNFEEQLKTLTVRLGEITTDLHNYQIAYSELKKKYDELIKENGKD